jgi:hypothetical protein
MAAKVAIFDNTAVGGHYGCMTVMDVLASLVRGAGGEIIRRHPGAPNGSVITWQKARSRPQTSSSSTAKRRSITRQSGLVGSTRWGLTAQTGASAPS